MVFVTSAYGNSYHSSENVQSGQFAFQAVEAGDYMACFFAIDHQPPLKIPVEFDWRSGVAAKDWSNVAKKGSVDAMEYELKKLADTITSIHDEMIYLRDRLVNNLPKYSYFISCRGKFGISEVDNVGSNMEFSVLERQKLN
ncbi:putative transmembrane emp24 domain-containing protein [Helianthus debilis subsp. tardiflorus]